MNAETIFRVLSRDLGHPLLRHPAREEWKQLPADTPYWIHSNYTIDRPGNYLDRILLIKGTRTETQVAATMSAEGALSEATVGYNIGLWHLLNGRKDRAREYFTRALASGYSTAWGYRAAEADLKRLDAGAVK